MPETQIANASADNPTSGVITVKAGKTTYLLEWNLAAIAMAEKRTGVKLLYASLAFENMGLGEYSGLLWACLSKHQPKITLEEVYKLIAPRYWKRFSDGMIKAWRAAQPETDEDDEGGQGENPLEPDA